MEDGTLVVLGITQEQHSDRCRLFSQWQQFDWPILWDPINSLESEAVPIVVAIDEHGIVRSTRPRLETFEQEFLDSTSRDEKHLAPAARTLPDRLHPVKPELSGLRNDAAQSKTAKGFRDWADTCVLWRGESGINDAIKAYTQALKLEDDANTLFRSGVAYRLRYDSGKRHPADFQTAVRRWEQALTKNPNQYIWRRRIQQYGPRLDKPYSFYDWVDQARREITERGDTPISLAADPYGAELAHPADSFTAEPPAAMSPDPDGRIQRDADSLIQSEVTLVPSKVSPGDSIRVHIAFTPNIKLKSHWNNEADPLQVWIDVPEGWQVSQQLHAVTSPENKTTSDEIRRVDFEVQVAAKASGIIKLPVYALYSVCEDENGTCFCLRQDMSVETEVLTNPDSR